MAEREDINGERTKGQNAGISKRFCGVTTLQDVDLDAYAGEVLAIVGDNGAGKSTRIKILTGVYQPSGGGMFLDGLGLDAIRRGELDATPMRMGNDVGAATAEAIKADLEGGRADELPLVFLGRITVAHDQMSGNKIDALEKEASRFSRVGALNR